MAGTLTLTDSNGGDLELTARSRFGAKAIWVALAADGGNDNNPGHLHYAPKATISAALNALPQGGTVFLYPGLHYPGQTLFPKTHSIVGLTSPMSGFTHSNCALMHDFDGPMVDFEGYGGGLRNLYFFNTGDYEGAAIRGIATADTPSGFLWCENLLFSGSTGWEYDVYLDGSARLSPIGYRSVHFDNCQFFGGTTQYKTVYLNTLVHAFFTNCEIIQAPSATDVGLWIDGATSEDIYWTGGQIAGRITSYAAGGFVFNGRVSSDDSGSIVCETGSAKNVFLGDVHEVAFTNNGDTGGANKNRLEAIDLPSARVFRSTTQSINTATDTAITYTGSRWNRDAIWSSSSNPNRVTPGIAGRYSGVANIEFEANATGIREVRIRLNGGTTIANARQNALTAGATTMSVPFVYELDSDDYVEVIVHQTSGGALNIASSVGGSQNELSIARAN